MTRNRSRSTREKIKRIGQEIQKSLETCEGRLKRIDELCQGRSEHIDNNMPIIVTGFDALKSLVDRWVEGL